jgi:hypothetical protein
MCTPEATWETSTVVLDRLNIINRLNVISSGSVVYMKIDPKYVSNKGNIWRHHLKSDQVEIW